MRTAEITRNTAETQVKVALNLDGEGKTSISTGVGFFDHMLTLFCRHALIDADIQVHGDLQVDAHHTIEDTGIVLGQAVAQALGDKRGITRYGSMLLPMEEALARVVLDFSGRALLVYDVPLVITKAGDFDVALAREFFRAFALNAGLNLHIDLLKGDEPHHALEAVFKGTGRAVRAALTLDPREHGIPSSKGTL